MKSFTYKIDFQALNGEFRSVKFFSNQSFTQRGIQNYLRSKCKYRRILMWWKGKING